MRPPAPSVASSTDHRDQVSALEKLHAKHVLPGFADRTAEEKEIEAATIDITRVCDHALSFRHSLFDTCFLGALGLSAVSPLDTAHWF